MKSLSKSWIYIPAESDFSLDNIPFGICSFPSSLSTTAAATTSSSTTLAPSTPRCCTAIGNYAIDLHLLAEAGLLDNLVSSNNQSSNNNSNNCGEEGQGETITNFHPRIIFSKSTLNEFMSCERCVWEAVRNRLIRLFLLDDGDGESAADNRLQTNSALQSQCMHHLSTALYHLPATIGDYTDFYSSREHATNVGIMFRGVNDALQPNWLHLPVGYHGRSSSVFPSVTSSTTAATPSVEEDEEGSGCGDDGEKTRMSMIRRPCGQLQIDPLDPKRGSTYGPCKLMDFELEVAFFVGGPTNNDDTIDSTTTIIGKPLTTSQAQDRIFGYVLMNDWSARDIQKWEYVPLGPFTSKNFATTISTWVVTTMALEPFRCETSARVQGNSSSSSDPIPLDYLKDPNYGSYDVNLTVSIQPSNASKATQICNSNLKHMYWSSVQQLVHHSVTGCPMRAGDLLASGTISGVEQHNFGSMLELSWKGTREIELDGGEVRKFLKDGDAVIMKGWCEREGVGRVGFGQCSGKILPAIPFRYESQKELTEEVVVGTTKQAEQKYSNFKLYGYWRSSCSWRVRIALAAKGIPYKTVPINLLEKVQMSDEYSLMNPLQQVPALEFMDGTTTVKITQSLAIIEFLESAFANQGGRLLPLDPVARAKVKEISEVVNSGTQPLQNLSVIGAIDSIAGKNGPGKEFGKKAIVDGLSAVEKLVAAIHSSDNEGVSHVGPFATGSFGPTLADACLAPQLYNARRFGVELESICPTLVEIEKKYVVHPWFQNARPEAQPDAMIA